MMKETNGRSHYSKNFSKFTSSHLQHYSELFRNVRIIPLPTTTVFVSAELKPTYVKWMPKSNG